MKSLKKLLAIALAATMMLTMAACGSKGDDGAVKVGSEGSICVLRNMSNSDHTAQFFEGCISEGNALGYKVDTFMSDQDDVKMQELMEQALKKDYKIWIVSHANEGYQFDMLTKAVEKGIKVVGFDCGGEHVKGVTYTSQEDLSLAALSLDALIESVSSLKSYEGGPVKFAEINVLGLIVPFDTRHSVIEEYVKDKKLADPYMVSPNLAGDAYSQIYTAITAFLNENKGAVGIWAASSGFLDGAVDAVKDAKREGDVYYTAIDISNTELARFCSVPNYYACAAVDPKVIGMVDVRLAVCKVLGEETPETYKFDAVNIFGTQIEDSDSMANLDKKFAGFGSSEEYNTAGIKALREKYASVQ